MNLRVTMSVRVNTYSNIMFSVITNIYNQKTKGPALLNAIVHSYMKTEKVFFAN
jgi:hypothetical protein